MISRDYLSDFAMFSEGVRNQLAQIVFMLPIPILLLLASHRWAKHVRKYLPRWRNALAALSISIASFNFLLLLTLFLLPLTHSSVPGELFISIFFSAPVGIALGFALKGLPRVQTILAGALTIMVWFANVDF